MDTLIALALIVRTGIKTKGDIKTRTAAAMAQSQSIPFQLIKLSIWLTFLIINFKLFGAWLGLHLELFKLRMAWEMFLVNQGINDLIVSTQSYCNGFLDGMGAGVIIAMIIVWHLRTKPKQ